MKNEKNGSWLKTLFIGKARDIHDSDIFHKLSLAAILAWVGLGADGLSSSCYGPEETMKALLIHPALAMFVALACVITIGVICVSYSQIIELFPSGGGGYLVASKLLSPSAGVVSGSALLVDYVLTIALSIAAGADALFSVLPPEWLDYKLTTAIVATLLLIIMNLRGVKESVIVWAPIFFIFLATHVFAVIYGFFAHAGDLPQIAATAIEDVSKAHAELGWWKIAGLLLTAYSLGAGSYTGIEAVSNGLPILQEPRVATGRRTMIHMGVSLAFMVGGLLMMYQFYGTLPKDGTTMNAVLFAQITDSWPPAVSSSFIWVSMFSAAALLFIAAQTGFLDGPRVIASMAVDRWFPTRFASLSDRFVAQNGIILMGLAALVLIWVSKGSVSWLVVLYSINVFVTFSLSQLGMVIHWSKEHSDPKWRRKLAINLIGFLMTATILVALVIIKFHEGGWVTVLVTGSIVALAFAINRHYREAHEKLTRLDTLIEVFGSEADNKLKSIPPCDPLAKTAVIFVNGFNGLGIHTTLAIQRIFPGVFKNYIFVEIGVVDAGNFKGASEIDHLEITVARETQRYADYMNSHGLHAESVHEIGTDIVNTARILGQSLAEKFPNLMFFGGQLVFEDENYFTRILHNFAVFGLQRTFFQHGLPFFVLPVRV
ncbi:MAG: APC family permease [Verrucomicrobiota bacterium]